MSAERLHDQRESANPALEDVVGGVAGNTAQGRPRPMLDPATGTRVISPERDRQIQKALRRAARHIAFRLFLRYPRLQFEYLALKLRYAVLRLRRYLAGGAFKRFFGGHSVRS
jgi:hypothetical protein